MLTQVAINRNVGDERNGRVLDVLEHLARGKLNSAANAAVSIIEDSPLFEETLAQIQSEGQSAAQKRKRKKIGNTAA